MGTMSSTLLWGERGLVTSLLVDLSVSEKRKGWLDLMAASHFQEPFSQGTPRAVLTVVEPDFSNEGFGHPDAAIRFDFDAGGPCVVILEAKRLPYAKSCVPPSNRGGAGYNSKLNGQLELNHCLALALSEYTADKKELIEPDWVLHTPYAIERRGRLRCLKNSVVLEELAQPLSRLPFRSYFHLLITTDESNPLDNPENETLWPQLYHPDYPFRNCWQELRGQYGWLSWDDAESILQRLQETGVLKESSLFLPTFEKNRRNFKVAFEAGVGGGLGPSAVTPSEEQRDREKKPLGPASITSQPGSRGATMIYAPELNPSTFLHFSWLNESCAIRDYSNSPNIMPFEDRTKRTSEVRANTVKEIFIRRRRPISDVAYWHETTVNLNKTELPTLRAKNETGSAAD